MRGFAEARVRRFGALAASLAVVAAGFVAAFIGNAGAITGGSISPTVLSASQQQFTITYSGKDQADPGDTFAIVQECIADDTKIGFNRNFDCSYLSLVNYSAAPADGSITYGGQPSNPFAPFVGIDPENGEWSVCEPASGVTNYQSGFFRMADSAADEADDIFIPFACEGTVLPTTTTTEPPTTTTEPTTTTTEPTTATTTTTVDGTTTTTTVDGTTTTTTSEGTTTTTLGEGATTTTVDGGGSGGSSGSGGRSGGSSAAALARTGLGAWPMVRLALMLLFVGTLLRARADGRAAQRLGSLGAASRRSKGMP